MERDRLARLMEHPAPPTKEDLVGLRTMTERYPWFSGAHLLLAIGDHAAGDVLFDEQLRTTAAHLPSRAVLHDLLDRPADVDIPAAPTDTRPVDGSNEESPSKDHVRPIVWPDLSEPIIDEVPAPVAEVELPPTPPPPTPRAAEVEPTPPSVLEPPAEPPAPSPVSGATVDEETHTDPLDELIRGTALANTYGLLLSEAAPFIPEVRQEPIVAPPMEVEPLPAPAPAGTVLPSRLRFTAWLDMGSSPVPGATPQEVPTRIAPTDTSAPAATPEAPMVQVAQAGGPDVEATKALIDRFIGLSAPTPAKKTEFFTPQQAAKRSLEDHADMVSETLARIHEQQGNIGKAVAAYRKLAARHPDRAEHFNALAEALTRR